MEADRDFFRRVRRDHSLPLPQTSAAGPNPHMFRQRSFGAPLSVGSSTRGSIPSVRWPMSPMASRKGDEDADSQGGAAKVIIDEINASTEQLRRDAAHYHTAHSEMAEPREAVHNPLDTWDFISASSDRRECHRCLTTHSFQWHEHHYLPTCHSCFVDLHRDACPFCGKRNPVKSADMAFCRRCCRSTHRSCEERMRGHAQPGVLCIVCEMELLLHQQQGSTMPSQTALKSLPTILNNHIFHYQQFFVPDPTTNAAPWTSNTPRDQLSPVRRERTRAEFIRMFCDTLDLDPENRAKSIPTTGVSEISNAPTSLRPGTHHTLHRNWPMSAHNSQTESPGDRQDGLEKNKEAAWDRESFSGGYTADDAQFRPAARSEMDGENPDFQTEKPAVSSLQELLDYNESLRRSMRVVKPRNAKVPGPEQSRRVVVLSTLHASIPAASSPDKGSPVTTKMFSWEKRLRTASEKMKNELKDPPLRRVPRPGQKYQHFKSKIDSWREADRRRIESASSVPLSAAERYEQTLRSALNHVSALVKDPQSTQASGFLKDHLFKNLPSLPRLGTKGGHHGVKETTVTPHMMLLASNPDDTRKKYRMQCLGADKVSSSSSAGKTNRTSKSESMTPVSEGENSYKKIMKFINNDLADFGNEVIEMCKCEYTPQQFFEAVYNVQYHSKQQEEPESIMYGEDSSADSVVAEFELYFEALHDISSTLANDLYILNKPRTRGVKLTATQAILVTMSDFGVYPTLLGTRTLTTIVLNAISSSVHGLPETEAQRYLHILKLVISNVAISVFRSDPEQLGVAQVVDRNASDSQLVRILMIYMRLDDQERLNTFKSKFATAHEIADNIRAIELQNQHRDRIAQAFSGDSDPVQRPIVRFQHALQDIFHFFGENCGQISATSPIDSPRRVIRSPRKSLERNSWDSKLTKKNTRKVQDLEAKRLELISALNVQEKSILDFDPRRATLQRVNMLKTYGSINRKEAAYLAECLASGESTNDPEVLKRQRSPEALAREREFRFRKGKVFTWITSKAPIFRNHLIVEDFVPLCSNDVAIAQITWDCIKKRNPTTLSSVEFVNSVWSDSLCECALAEMQEENAGTNLEEEDIRHTQTATSVEKMKSKVEVVIANTLAQLEDEVAEIIGGGGKSNPGSLGEDDGERLRLSFSERLRYEASQHVDVRVDVHNRSDHSQFVNEDDVPERCVSPKSRMSVGALVKFAKIFGWIGTEDEVQQGLALMQDFQLYEYFLLFSRPDSKFQLDWNEFLDLLIMVACNSVKTCHVDNYVQLNHSKTAYVEGLFYFMSLPDDATSRRDWLKIRVHDVICFRFYQIVDQAPPATWWLLPPANQPWREGLMLQNNFREITGGDILKLFVGLSSKPAQPHDGWELPGRNSPLLRLASHNSITSPLAQSRAPSVAPASPIRVPSISPASPERSETGTSFEDSESKGWFCVMFCDSSKDLEHHRNSQIFQAVAWRHPWKFFRMDISLDQSSRDYSKSGRNSVNQFPGMRLYCTNGLYRDYEGYWDVGTMDHWLRQQGIPEDFTDEAHMLEQDYHPAIQFCEVGDGLDTYLDTCLSLSYYSCIDGNRRVVPIKGFSMRFSEGVMRLQNFEFSCPEAIALANCFKHNRKLTAIDLSNCRLKAEGLVGILLALALNTKVRTLNLSCNRIGTRAKVLQPHFKSAALALQTEAATTDLEGMQLVMLSRSVEALASLMRCNTVLEHLSLRACGLDDDSIRAVAASLRVNLSLPLAFLDLSENRLGDASLTLLVKTFEVRHNHSKCIRLQHLDLSGNRITKIGHVWIARYLKDAEEADDPAKDIKFVLDQQQPDQDVNAPNTMPPQQDITSQDGTMSRIHAILADGQGLSLEEKFHLLKLYRVQLRAEGVLDWDRAWKLIEPFLESPLCFPATQWAYGLLVSVADKDSFAEQFDKLLQDRAQRNEKQRQKTGVTYNSQMFESGNEY